jgi:hypothetical protein
MKFIKKMSIIALATSMLLPVVSSAGLLGSGLKIQNNTNQDSTSIINNGLCSAKILGPKDGVTKAHGHSDITPFQLALACIGHSNDCHADVYMTNNCTGPIVGTVEFSTSTGIQSFNVLDPKYQLQGTGFYAQIDGGT